MLFRAAEELNINLAESIMVGDKQSDIEAGKRAGCKTILLLDSSERDDTFKPDIIASNWSDVLLYILN
jgi:D-glycero-D-manno-heptose 1,7-bisphosphate phosphatase